mmetsp:Transcript_44953/g.101158  ORF Transcript_44953/g.101158 Transcript_44953/m.101158 type:complete len:416 (-) Transcript_44953:22-1269(-)
MRVLFLTLEFAEPLFSGNGIWGRSLVRGLLQVEETLRVTVVCGGKRADYIPWEEALESSWGQRLEVKVVDLPLWRRLDRSCSWSEYAEQVAAQFSHATKQRLDFDLVLGLDWHSIYALEALEQESWSRQQRLPPYIFLNVRVFSSNAGVSTEDKKFYQDAESRAVKRASKVIAQTQRDADLLAELLSLDSCPQAGTVSRVAFHCPLRDDLRELAMSAEVDDLTSRTYLLCVSRLNPEKNLEAYVAAIEAVGETAFSDAGVVPVLLGAASDPPEYGEELIRRLKAACSFAEYKPFRPPAEVAQIYRQTRLYFHAALQEPYGMSPVEAAAFGAPAIMNEEGIGSAERLRPAENESFSAPMKDPAAVGVVLKALLANRSRLTEVGTRARKRALAWSEKDFAAAVLDEMKQVVAMSTTE